MKIKKLYSNYKKAEQVANVANEAWDLEPENENLEAAFDEAYSKEMKAFEALRDEISSLIGIEKRLAATMIRAKKAELENLINRIA